MKHHRLYHHLISLLLALSMIAAVGCLCAAGEETQAPVSQIENVQTEPYQQETQAQPQQEAPQEQVPQQEQPRHEPNQWYDPIYSYEEDTPSP